MGTDRLRVGLGTFADYLVAGAAGRLDWLARKRRTYESEYHPGGSFYDAWTRAVVQGRFAGDDAARLASAVEKASGVEPRWRAYEELSRGWLLWLGDDPRRPVRVGSSVWSAGGIDVSVRPQLGLVGADGSVDVVWLYLKGEPLTEDAAVAALRVLEMRMVDLFAGGRPVVVDVRRSREFTAPSRRRRGYDALLLAEAAGLAALWQYGQAS